MGMRVGDDIDLNKARLYRANFGTDHFHSGDVAGYSAADLPSRGCPRIVEG
jgi:hypothetical protein